MDKVKLTKQEATRAANKKYYESHRNQILEKQKLYKLKHKETTLNYHKEYNKEYYLKNKEQISQQQAIYKYNNADRLKEYYRQRYLSKKLNMLQK